MTEFMVLDFAMHEVDGGKVVWEYFEAQLDSSNDSWTDSSQEGLNSDPVAMDVSIEASDLATPSHGSVQSGSDSTDSSLLIRTGGTRIVVFKDEDNNNEPKFNVLGSSKYKAKTKWSYEIAYYIPD